MTSLRRMVSLASRGTKNYFQKRPFCVSFEVTYRCNARCRHCHLGGPVEEERAAPRKYAEICSQIRPVVAQVSGGEPLLRKDLEQIITSLKSPNKAPYVIVTTNGTLLTEEKYRSLRQAGVDEFSLSFDFPDERHDEFRKVPGLFRHIKNLLEKNTSNNDKAITLSCVIQKKNFRDLIRMAHLAREWNVKMNFSTYTWLRTNNKDYLIPPEEIADFESVIKELLDFKKKHKTVVTSPFVFRKMVDFFKYHTLNNCRAGERFLVVNPDGTLSPCGLIIRDYTSQEEIIKNFLKDNTCGECYTSIRANTERPARYLISDNLRLL